MITLNGKYNTAKVFTDNIEETAISQVIELCNQEFCRDSTIRIMPDVHAGAGCTIGTTMTVTDKVVPNLVGVDIGCGMEVIILKEKEIDLEKLDGVIRNRIPSGFNVRETAHPLSQSINFQNIKCLKHINLNRAILSIGTLGGGNHFIEVNKDDIGNLYLVIHSGSRNLGKQIAEYYQGIAYKELSNIAQQKQATIKILRQQGRESEIESELKKIQPAKVNKELAYLQGDNFQNYINDMTIVQDYAECNRRAMASEIIAGIGCSAKDQFTTIHNYIEPGPMILRKGAISAKEGEMVIVPLNMRDGSIVAVGKGNADWNYSAPHGAGRLMSRSKAKKELHLEDFKESMKGIYTTSVNDSTLDECPMAYKPISDILDNVSDTIEVVNIIKPIYNFKSA